MRILIAALAAGACVVLAQERSPFSPSNLETASGRLADPDGFFEAADCGECHKDQYRQWKGSLHSRAHHDSIYLAFARRAREEGGDDLYRFCSGCHAAAAVATGEIPGGEATFLTDEGVTCDVCHRVARVRARHAGGGANGSIVLEEGEERYGPIGDPAPNPVHKSVHSETFTRAEFCSACHTLTHPKNGLVIENTYEEWRKGPYAEAGIACQDCHMRTVEQAMEVARTMKPLRVPGKAAEDGDERPDVHAHLFAGANTNGALVGAGDVHVAEAQRRLESAATIALELAEGSVVVAVTNVGAGHAIPTSITELRQVWIDLSVKDANGKEIFRSGAVDANGRVDPDAVMYHSVLVDEEGEVTYLPWRAVRMAKERLIGPKETVRETYEVAVPEGTPRPLAVRALLRYRSAPQEVMDELFGKGKYLLNIVDMASAEQTADS